MQSMVKAALGAFFFLSACSDAKPHPNYVLVHGAWMGAWAWDDVASGLRASGANVSIVELPAHGNDATPISSASLDAYVAKVGAVVDAQSQPVVLVAHSMGGVVATQVAEQKPDKIAKLVYLAAYVPKDGESLFALAMKDADSHVGSALEIDMSKGTAAIPMDKLGDIFCADCDAAKVSLIQSKYRDEPVAPLATPVHTTAANWGRVPKMYVFTKNDHAVSYGMQQSMTAGLTLAKSVTLDASHSPFLSEPGTVVSTLLE